MFNADDYNDNIEYCRYVFEKNLELNLGLNSPREIQNVANNYLDEIYARRGNVEDEVYDNEKILNDVVEKFHRKFRKFRAVDEFELAREMEPAYELNPEEQIKSDMEKLLNTKAGYSYDESYDDKNIEGNVNLK